MEAGWRIHRPPETLSLLQPPPPQPPPPPPPRAVGRATTYRQPGAELASAGDAPPSRTPGLGEQRSGPPGARCSARSHPEGANNPRLGRVTAEETREGIGCPASWQGDRAWTPRGQPWRRSVQRADWQVPERCASL